MKTKNLALLVGFLIATSPQARGQSQTEMNQKSGQDTASTKHETKMLLRALATKYRSVSGFKNKLDESQELFNNFTQGHVSSVFPIPKGKDSNFYGSDLPMCTSIIEGELWLDRKNELQNWAKEPKKLDLATAQAEYGKVDRHLNDIYVKVKKSPAKSKETGPQFLKELTNAEVEWIAFRNSDSELYGMTHGSEASKYQKMIELTKQRTEQLNRWLVGKEEGDVCSGSIPTH